MKALDAKRLADEGAASKLRTIKDPTKDGKAAEAGGTKGDGAQKVLKDADGAEKKGKTNAEAADEKKKGKDARKEGEDSSTDEKTPSKKEEAGKEDQGSDDKSVAGRKKMKNPKSKEERLVEAELNQILKRSPSEFSCISDTMFVKLLITISLPQSSSSRRRGAPTPQKRSEYSRTNTPSHLDRISWS